MTQPIVVALLCVLVLTHSSRRTRCGGRSGSTQLLLVVGARRAADRHSPIPRQGRLCRLLGVVVCPVRAVVSLPERSRPGVAGQGPANSRHQRRPEAGGRREFPSQTSGPLHRGVRCGRPMSANLRRSGDVRRRTWSTGKASFARCIEASGATRQRYSEAWWRCCWRRLRRKEAGVDRPSSATRHNTAIRALRKRQVTAGTLAKQASIACMRKLIVHLAENARGHLYSGPLRQRLIAGTVAQPPCVWVAPSGSRKLSPALAEIQPQCSLRVR